LLRKSLGDEQPVLGRHGVAQGEVSEATVEGVFEELGDTEPVCIGRRGAILSDGLRVTRFFEASAGLR
jgi:hypothetical protein